MKKEESKEIKIFKTYQKRIGVISSVLVYSMLVPVGFLCVGIRVGGYLLAIGAGIFALYLVAFILYCKLVGKKMKALELAAYGKPDKNNYSPMFKEALKSDFDGVLRRLNDELNGYKLIFDDLLEGYNIISLALRIKDKKRCFCINLDFENESATLYFKKETEENTIEYDYSEFTHFAALEDKIAEDICTYVKTA